MKTSVKLLIGGVGLLLFASIVFGIYGLVRSSGFDLFEQALDGEATATCTITPEGEEEIAFYFKNGDLRIVGRIDIEVEEPAPSNFMIKDGVYYEWNPGDQQGIKGEAEGSSLREATGFNWSSEEEIQQVRQDFEAAQGVCQRGVEESMFELPDDIEFVDIREELETDEPPPVPDN